MVRIVNNTKSPATGSSRVPTLKLNIRSAEVLWGEVQYCTNPEEMALNGRGDLGRSMKALSALNVDIDPWPCDLADCDRVPVIVRGMRALTSAWNALTATPAPRFARVARVAFDIEDTTD